MSNVRGLYFAPAAGLALAIALVGQSAASAAPAGPEVELLHAAPGKIAVSSVVANAAMHPAYLADGDLSTAWNSRSGDLAGAWIAFRVPAAAHVTKIRLTAGFTASGPEGDTFLLNHRVRRVRVVHGGASSVHELDVSNRGLQDVPIDAGGGDFRVELIELVPGSQKRWREACVSEIEVWGVLAGATPGTSSPTVAVGSLDAPPMVDRALEAIPLGDHASIAAYCAQRAAREKPSRLANPPACGAPAKGPTLAPLPAGWTSVSYFLTPWGQTEPDCNLAIVSGGRVHVVEDIGTTSCGAGSAPASFCDPTRQFFRLDGDRVAIVTSIPAPAPADALRFEVGEELRVCGPGPDKAISCTAPISVGHKMCRGFGDGLPGADGLSVEVERWSIDVRLTHGLLDLRAGEGALDAEARASLGRYRLSLE